MTRGLLLTGALLVAVTGCGEQTPAAERDGDGRLVMVSGRDDHGLLTTEQVAVHASVEGRPTGAIPDGTLVSVLDREGQWLRVQTVEGEAVAGWVDDFLLRGELRLVGPAPTCEARMAGDLVEGGTVVTAWRVDGDRVLVETVAGQRRRGWAARSDLQELPPQGRSCGGDPPGSGHRH
ncbi:MAG TPA: hypothetical protein VF728_04770 [Nocardioides sp.]